MSSLARRRIDSPVGPLDLVVDEAGALTEASFADHGSASDGAAQAVGAGEAPSEAAAGTASEAAAGTATEAQRAALDRAASQLGEYFAGQRRAFELALAPHGTDFEQRVWRALAEIPFGETWSYRRLAERIDAPRAVRAVGRANGKNPLAIIVPCHRVIGADGSLTGYAGGLDRKRHLLAHEGAQPGCADADTTTPRGRQLALF